MSSRPLRPLKIIDGTPGADALSGGAAADELFGFAGNDTLLGSGGNDWLQPGSGNDSVRGGAGTDALSYQDDDGDLPATRGADVDLARGTAIDPWSHTDTLADIEWVFGSARADRLVGNSLGNVLDGGLGNDTIHGGGAEDWLQPGPGNDSINGGSGVDVVSYIDSEGDATPLHGVTANLRSGKVTDPWNGSDTLTGVENLVGSSLADTLSGAGQHTLLDGRAGNDSFSDAGIVYAGDPGGVFVNLGATSRTVGQQTVSPRRARDGFGDTDTLGSGVTSGYGTPFDDIWFGGNTSAYAILRAGDDRVQLGSGDDWLMPGSGNDTVDGGGGFDGISYEDDGFDSAGSAFQGVQVDLAAGSAVDGWNASDVLSGIEDIYGSALADELSGNARSNFIDGGAGDDTLAGGDGDDYFIGGAGDDRIDGGAGFDFVALAGADLGDYRIEIRSDGTIIITDLKLADGDDGTDTLTGIEQIGFAVRGGASDDTLVSDAEDPIIGLGEDGNDRYVLRFAEDHVVERANQGSDTVEAGISRTLEPNVENLLLTGQADVNGTGNSAANRLTGNGGDNLLDGAAGADTLAGGDGDDTYRVDNPSDAVIEGAGVTAGGDPIPLATGGGIDTVIAQVSYTLRANVENLQLAGSASLNGTGNELANVLTGNSAANRLGGLGGADILDGGGGSDTLAGGSGNDTLGGGTGADHFLFDTAPVTGNVDTLVDFVPGSERIRLDDDAFVAFDAAKSTTLTAAQFHKGPGASTAHDTDDRIVYDSSSGVLYYDADGIGGAAAIRFAVLAAHPALGAGDFLITG